MRNILLVDNEVFLVFQEFLVKETLYDVPINSEDVGVYLCKNLSDTVQAVSLNDVQKKCYRMPHWSHKVGEEELPLENEWICCTLISEKEMM